MKRILLRAALGGLLALAATQLAQAALVGYWNFDNVSDLGQAQVSSDLAVFGTGVTYTASGRYGGAASMDGNGWFAVDASYTLADNMPVGDSDYTIMGWVRTTTVSANGLIGWGNYGSTNQVNALRTGIGNGDGYIINYNWGNDLRAGNAAAYSVYNDEWHHIAATYNTATNTKVLYIDGVFLADALGVSTLSVGAAGFTVGSTNTNIEMFAGLLDEVRVYDTALTQTEIQQAMAVPEPGVLCLGLLALTGLAARRRL